MKYPEADPENSEGSGRDNCQLYTIDVIYFNEYSLKKTVNTNFTKKGVAAVHSVNSLIRPGYLSKNLTNSILSFIYFDFKHT